MIKINKTSTTNTTAKPGRSIEYIVIHYTAGLRDSGTADESTAAYFSKDTTKASADFIVDGDSVTVFNPDIPNRYTWHCGGSKYNTKGGTLLGKCTNSNSIGIEMCSHNTAGKVAPANDPSWAISDATVKNAVDLVKELMAAYKIPASRVVRHYDVTGKLCPGVVGWNEDSGDTSSWDKFKSQLAANSTPTSVTEDHINELMSSASFKVFEAFGKATIVAAQFPSGYVITESSACVDPTKYDKDQGISYCKERIANRLWELEGYLLQNALKR